MSLRNRSRAVKHPEEPISTDDIRVVGDIAQTDPFQIKRDESKRKEGAMKRLGYAIIATLLVGGLIGCASTGKGKLKGTVAVETPEVMMSKKAKVIIKGMDFKPGQEVRLLLITADGVTSDIGGYLKPAPVADQTGAWTTTWNCGRYIGRKLIKEGTYTITVTDPDYNPITEAPITFYAKKK